MPEGLGVVQKISRSIGKCIVIFGAFRSPPDRLRGVSQVGGDMIMPSQKSSYQLPCDMRHATLPVIVEKKKVAYPGNTPNEYLPERELQHVRCLVF